MPAKPKTRETAWQPTLAHRTLWVARRAMREFITTAAASGVVLATMIVAYQVT